jgi:putative SOS response-associated peptidase YedK
MCNTLRYKDRAKQPYSKWEFSHVRIDPPRRWKVPPSVPAPVVTVRDGKAQIDMMEFGWRTDKGRQLMARGETVEEKNLFKKAFTSNRCLILADGFYDSQDMGKYMQPWHFQMKDDEPMVMAGLWQTHPAAECFTIMSAPANELVRRVIDRMPVILQEDQREAWLDPDTPEEALKSLLSTLPAAQMESWPVTRKLLTKGFPDGPDCIARLSEEQDELF